MLPFDFEIYRVMVYIDNTSSFDTLEDELMAYQAILCLSRFYQIYQSVNEVLMIFII